MKMSSGCSPEALELACDLRDALKAEGVVYWEYDLTDIRVDGFLDAEDVAQALIENGWKR